MKTINANYAKNIEILKINIARGMDPIQAGAVIDNMAVQFIRAGLYNKEAREYIQAMQKVAGIKTIQAVDLARNLGIEVVEN